MTSRAVSSESHVATARALVLALVGFGSVVLSLLCWPTKPTPIGDRDASSPPATVQEVGSPWSDLTEAQQATLHPLMLAWPSFDSARKRRWLLTATHLVKLSASAQERAQSRMTSWAGLSAYERSKARLQFVCAGRSRKSTGGRRSADRSPGDGAASGKVTHPIALVPAMVRVGPGATTIALSELTGSVGAICQSDLPDRRLVE